MIPKATQSSFLELRPPRGPAGPAEEFDVELLWKGPSSENDRAGQKQVTQQFTNAASTGICSGSDRQQSRLPPRSAPPLPREYRVLIFDSAVDGEAGKDFISFVATDNTVAGELGGKHLMELVGKEARRSASATWKATKAPRNAKMAPSPR